MKHKRLNISLYWKCQLAGWTLGYIYSTFIGFLNNVPLGGMIAIYSFFIVIGILLTHLMKNIMERWQILQKKNFYQMGWILISTIILSILYMFITQIIITSLNSRNFIHEVINADRTHVKYLFIYFGQNAQVFLIWNLFYFAYNYVQKAKKEDLEGIIAKDVNSIYTPGGRSSDWKKIKTHKRQEFVICGFIEKAVFCGRIADITDFYGGEIAV